MRLENSQLFHCTANKLYSCSMRQFSYLVILCFWGVPLCLQCRDDSLIECCNPGTEHSKHKFTGRFMEFDRVRLEDVVLYLVVQQHRLYTHGLIPRLIWEWGHVCKRKTWSGSYLSGKFAPASSEANLNELDHGQPHYRYRGIYIYVYSTMVLAPDPSKGLVQRLPHVCRLSSIHNHNKFAQSKL